MTQCKICNGDTHYYNSCDFNRTIETNGVPPFEDSGEMVDYIQCNDCRFIFTTHFDQLTEEQFGDKIYNEEYKLADPHWDGTRARRDAPVVVDLFQPCSVLDYGGGAGLLAELLKQQGFSTQSYDPFYRDTTRPTGLFDLVTCFEVFEHTPDPIATLQDCVSFLKPDGSLFISTLLVDFLAPNAISIAQGASFIAPRNGHISIHTRESFTQLLALQGMQIVPNSKIPKDAVVKDLDRFFIAKRV